MSLHALWTPPSEQLAQHVGWIVAAASLHPRAEVAFSALPCRHRETAERCRGRIELQATDLPEEVRYMCGHCGDGGIVTDWREGPFDMSEHRPTLRAEPQLGFSITDGEYGALRVLQPHPVTAAATPGECDDDVRLSGSQRTMAELLGRIGIELRRETPRRRRLLTGVWQRLQRTLPV
jgi:hypothetical protein